MATEYVRLTFKPRGAKRNRTVWAERAGKRSFWIVDQNAERPDPEHLVVIVNEADAKVVPAILSKKYCMLFLPDDPDLNNEVDRPEQVQP